MSKRKNNVKAKGQVKNFLLGLLLVVISVVTALLVQNFSAVKDWFGEKIGTKTLGVGEYNLTKIITDDNLIEYPESYENMYDLGLTKSSLEEDKTYQIDILDKDGDIVVRLVGTMSTDASGLGGEIELEDGQFYLIASTETENALPYGVLITFNFELTSVNEIESIEGSRIIFLTDGHELPEGLTTMKISVVEE